MEVIHNKLVRDNILDIMQSLGKDYTYHIADDSEYRNSLLTKLTEEMEEFKRTPNEEEAADILEVIYTLFQVYDLNLDNIEKIRQDKNKQRGSFTRKIILEKVFE